MEKATNVSPGLTRGDKVHKKCMDRLVVVKDGLTHGLDSFTLIHKQTLDSSSEYTEIVSKSQEPERSQLLDIIKTSEDETKRKEAYDRLRELDDNKEQEIGNHNEFLQDEGDKANKKTAGTILLIVYVSGLITSKPVRQATGKLLTTMGKNFTWTVN